MKYYIATGLENIPAHHKVRDAIRPFHTLTYDWTVHGPVWHGGSTRMAEVSSLEIEAVHQADFVIVLLPGGRGTHIEMGAALVEGKPVLLYSEDEEKFLVNENACAFYHHPLVKRFNCLDGLIDRAMYMTGEAR